MLLFIFVIVSIGFAIGLIFFLKKSKKSAVAKPETVTEDKPFVFSSEKSFVHIPKQEMPKAINPAIKKFEFQITQKPASSFHQKSKPEIKKQSPKEKKIAVKTEKKIKGPSEAPKSGPDADKLDFNRLSALIEDFFADDSDPKDFQ